MEIKDLILIEEVGKGSRYKLPLEGWPESSEFCYFQYADGSRLISPAHDPCDQCGIRYVDSRAFELRRCRMFQAPNFSSGIFRCLIPEFNKGTIEIMAEGREE